MRILWQFDTSNSPFTIWRLKIAQTSNLFFHIISPLQELTGSHKLAISLGYAVIQAATRLSLLKITSLLHWTWKLINVINVFTEFELIILSLSHNLSSQESFQYFPPAYVSFFRVVPFYQEFQPTYCLNLNHPLELSHYPIMVRLSLLEPNCLSLLQCKASVTKQGDVPWWAPL